jgi:hypothetical protein
MRSYAVLEGLSRKLKPTARAGPDAGNMGGTTMSNEAKAEEIRILETQMPKDTKSQDGQ